MLKIRQFHSSDAVKLWHLKFRTIREVNIKDYSLKQVSVWAPDEYDKTAWLARISKINPFIVEKNGVIAAYADLQDSGHIEHFGFVVIKPQIVRLNEVEMKNYLMQRYISNSNSAT